MSNKNTTLSDLQAAWGTAIDEVYREAHEHLLDRGWHFSVVTPTRHCWMPLIALRYVNLVIVWINWNLFFQAFAHLTRRSLAPYDWDDVLHKLTVTEAEEDPWNSLGDNFYLLEVLAYGNVGSAAEMEVIDDDLYIGFLKEYRFGSETTTAHLYAAPLPIRLPLKSLFQEYSNCLQELNALKSQLPMVDSDGEEPLPPSPGRDTWVVNLKEGELAWQPFDPLNPAPSYGACMGAEEYR